MEIKKVICDFCKEDLGYDDKDMSYFVHVYLYHSRINEQVCKQQRGEPYKTFSQLQADGLVDEKGFDKT